MAGLLDFLSTPDGRLGLGLLAAAGPQATPMSFGQRVQQGMQISDDSANQLMRQKFLQSQIDENASQAELRKLASAKDARQQELVASFFGGGPAQGAQSSQGAAPGQPSDNQIMSLAKRLNIPPQAIQADILFNGGKKISEMLSSRSAPNWTNVNGNLVNTNAEGFSGGLQPGMNASANGQVTAWQPDGKGGLVVGAPAGAIDTYSAYQNAGKRAENRNTLAPLDRINPQTGRPYTATVDDLVNNAPGGYGTEKQMKVEAGGPMGADPEAIKRELERVKSDLLKPLDPESKAQLQNYASGLVAQLEVAQKTPFPGYAGPADTTKLIDTAKADVVRDTAKQTDAKRYGQITAGANRALELLKQGPTESGMGAAVDASAGFFGKSTKGADVASQLDTLSGWMTANVPRMEGPQSDRDVIQYKLMSAQVGDRTKPVSQRIAAVEELQKLQNKYAAINGYKSEGGASGDFGDGTTKPQPKVVTLADIAVTAKNSGRTTAEVTKALKEKGFTIGGN